MKITHLLNDHTHRAHEREQFAFDTMWGLNQTPKRLASKYFYDDMGSRLFQKITEQKEYYLTRTELELLEENARSVVESIQVPELDIIELGAGDGQKTKIILDAFTYSDRIVHYYPIDISSEAMVLLRKNILEHKNLEMDGIIADYEEGLGYVRRISSRPALVMFLGSNIGNFNKHETETFLHWLWQSLTKNDYLLLGFDLKKDIPFLLQAYNDAAGFTREFNLNLLKRINRELGGDFDLTQFYHYGSYNPTLGAMESYLISRVPQDVHIERLQRTFHFEAFEPIYLECSMKYSTDEVRALAGQNGFYEVKSFLDRRKFFLESLWQVASL